MMKKTGISILAAAFAVVLTGACDGGGEDKPDAKKPEVETKKAEPEKKAPEAEPAHEPDPKVTKAAGIAKEIEAKPEEADEILAKHELDRDKFEAMIKDIAKDPQMSSDYEDLLMGT